MPSAYVVHVSAPLYDFSEKKILKIEHSYILLPAPSLVHLSFNKA